MAPHRARWRAPQLRRVALFVILTFAFTWAWWIPAGLIERGILTVDVPPMALLIVGGLGPAVAALICASTALGGEGIRAFLRNAFRWRAPWRFYGLATVGMTVMVLGTVPLHLALGARWDGEGAMKAVLALLPMFVLTFTLGGGIDEELGWRAFALPRLQATLPPWAANVLLGLVWSLWHLPLWWNPGVAQYDSNYAMYVVSTTGYAIVLGWLYNSTHGNTVVVIVAHTVTNVSYGLQAAAIDPVYQWVDVVVMGGAAVLIWAITRGRIGLRTVTSDPASI
ncbi:CPBP family intramembrane metalloprotease [Nocardia uniformis]|uniref:CPBP family intramembrane metalloprotease n=1 Tax=Nocardia uniformis TaxID=53432 RepID=A0A849CC89_9NOCA|nr:type II CAAX endopeptidase family protein [Nocardia uniformis]NNH70601.1 CPBP family intramembrane metalloprotease [Nocardia uniformis]